MNNSEFRTLMDRYVERYPEHQEVITALEALAITSGVLPRRKAVVTQAIEKKRALKKEFDLERVKSRAYYSMSSLWAKCKECGALAHDKCAPDCPCSSTNVSFDFYVDDRFFASLRGDSPESCHCEFCEANRIRNREIDNEREHRKLPKPPSECQPTA
jgi:hypothetical protein